MVSSIRHPIAYHIDGPSRIASRRKSGGRAKAPERGNWAALQDHLPGVFVSDCQPVCRVERKGETYSVGLFVQCLEHLGTLSRTCISDVQFMLISINILPSSSNIVVLLIRIRFSIIIIGSEEEMDSGRLNLCVWVEDGQRNDGNSLGVGPDFLLP